MTQTKPKDPAPHTITTPAKTPLNLLRPLRILSISLYYMFDTILHLLLTFQLSTLLSLSAFQSAWFARFWAYFGPLAAEYAAPAVMPLLRNHARGVCLDIGPGSGQWLYLFQRANNPDITKIYGVEPNVGLHPALRESARKAGLEGVYEVIGCGAEELQTKGGLQPGSIDTIITVQCLCSIPTPQKIIKELYPLLKSGGEWLVFEHIKTKYQGYFVGYWQKVINIVWPHMLGGCNATRPTDEWLLKTGDWKKVNLRGAADEGPYDTMPHIIGTLTKK